jgi:hypothetical protein
MRWMVDTGDAFLAVSMWGDVVEWSGKSGVGSVTKSFLSGGKSYAVDDVAFSRSKQILVVGYLGSKQDKATVKPPSQVALFERKLDSRVRHLFKTMVRISR